MRVTSTIGMRRACPSCSTTTAVGRFQTNPPFGKRTSNARDLGVTVMSSTVTDSAGASRAPSLSMNNRMHTSLLVLNLVRGCSELLAVRLPQQTCLPANYVRASLPFVDTYGVAGLGLLGDPTRRAIFELLARRPSSVAELAQQLPISRPAVSQHLRVLKDGGLVVSRPEGTRRVYRLNPDGVTALRAYLDRIWDQALTAFQKAAEAAPVDPEQEER